MRKETPVMILLKVIFICVTVALGVTIARAAETVELGTPVSTSLDTMSDAELLSLIRAKYDRDVKTPAGRIAWHGKLERQVINTNLETKVEIYADGKEFKHAWKVATPAKAVEARNKRLKQQNKGIPPGLAKARELRESEKSTTNTVIKVLKSGK